MSVSGIAGVESAPLLSRPVVPWQGATGLSGAAPTSFSLTDAAEELSFNFSERVEKKKFEERSLRNYRAPEIPDLEQVLAIYGRLEADGDPASLTDSLGRLSRELWQLAGNGGDLPAALQRWSSDPSRQYLALCHALRSGGAEGRAQEVLRDALEHLLAGHGPAIRADLNTLDQAAAMGPGQAAAETFRATYRDAVLGNPSMSKTLQQVLERFGNDPERGLELLRQALAADLAAAHPSSQAERLNAILQDLYQLSAVTTVLQRCRLLVGRLGRCGLMKVPDALSLMKDVVRWLDESIIYNYHVAELLRKHGLGETHQALSPTASPAVPEDGDDQCGPEAVFLNAVLDILRHLPDKVFSGAEHRHALVNVVTQMLDDLLLEG